jgi:hypothetical protein
MASKIKGIRNGQIKNGIMPKDAGIMPFRHFSSNYCKYLNSINLNNEGINSTSNFWLPKMSLIQNIK